MGTGKRRAVNGVRRAPAPSGDPAPGLFLVLEGIDGAGKSVQARRLAVWLRERGERVVETREPTDGVWGQRYRAWARGDLQGKPEEVLRFFVEDRIEHIARVIGPALEAGSIVVCDRYVASTRAYQAAQGLDANLVAERMKDENFPEPDISLWLRLPVAQALKRLGPSANERFEQAAFLERVDAEYERLGLEEVDATGSLDDVAQAIQKRVGELLRY